MLGDVLESAATWVDGSSGLLWPLAIIALVGGLALVVLGGVLGFLGGPVRGLGGSALTLGVVLSVALVWASSTVDDGGWWAQVWGG